MSLLGISAVDWGISLQIGLQIDFDSLKRVPSLHWKPDVDLWLYGNHLEKLISRHNSAKYGPFSMKFGGLMHDDNT